MKNTLVASIITLTVLSSAKASANLVVTSMDFGGNYAATGSINDDGTIGTFNSDIDFLSFPWTATQETQVITNSNGVSWAGGNTLGVWDFASDIALMRDDQVAVGVFWNWNNNNDVAILAVFDCTSGMECVGQTEGVGGVPFGGMQTFVPGSLMAFNGVGNLSTVPVPATTWLMGSGLIGLIGVARRRKVA